MTATRDVWRCATLSHLSLHIAKLHSYSRRSSLPKCGLGPRFSATAAAATTAPGTHVDGGAPETAAPWRRGHEQDGIECMGRRSSIRWFGGGHGKTTSRVIVPLPA